MAITNKLKVYAENSTNVLDDTDYDASSVREQGAQAGQAISSELTNTAIKSNSLLAVGLVDALKSLVTTNITEEIGLSKTSAQIATSLENIFKQIFLDRIYPVGSIYMSTNNVSPASFLGGTWSAIQDKFLVAVGSSGSISTSASQTGGAKSVTLVEANLPSHKHTYSVEIDRYTQSYTTSSNGNHSHDVGIDNGGELFVYGSGSDRGNKFTGSQGSGYQVDTTTVGAHTHTVEIDIPAVSKTGLYTSSVGSNTAFSIIPPYFSTYMWRRTA